MKVNEINECYVLCTLGRFYRSSTYFDSIIAVVSYDVATKKIVNNFATHFCNLSLHENVGLSKEKKWKEKDCHLGLL